MQLRSKFVVSMVLITVVVSVAALAVVRYHTRESALSRARTQTAGYIKAMARGRLTASDFTGTELHRRQKTFREFMDAIRTRDIIKIKVINSRFNIIYSTNEADIGRRTDSINYRDSLLNSSVIAVIQPAGNEASNMEMREHRQLMEIYVPIEYQGVSAGVIEVYFRMDEIDQEMLALSTNTLVLILALSLCITGVGYALLTCRPVRPLQPENGRS